MSTRLVATALSRGVLFAAQLSFADASEMLESKREFTEIVREGDDWAQVEVRAIQEIVEMEKSMIEIFVGVYGDLTDELYYYVKHQ